MAQSDSRQDVQPFLNPRYWGGKQATDYGATEQWQDPRPLPSARASALMNIVRFIARGRGVVDGTVVPVGDTFDPNNFAIGTIVKLQIESLSSTVPLRRFSPATLTGLPVPELPRFHEWRTARSNDRIAEYVSGALIGTVEYDHSGGGKLVYGVFEHDITREDDRIDLPVGTVIPATPIQIGVTRHFPIDDGRLYEELERVTELQYYRAGTTAEKDRAIVIPL